MTNKDPQNPKKKGTNKSSKKFFIINININKKVQSYNQIFNKLFLYSYLKYLIHERFSRTREVRISKKYYFRIWLAKII